MPVKGTDWDSLRTGGVPQPNPHTETFPVAEQLAYAWHVGEAMEAASERWGFAFSAKKKWKPKLQ